MQQPNANVNDDGTAAAGLAGIVRTTSAIGGASGTKGSRTRHCHDHSAPAVPAEASGILTTCAAFVGYHGDSWTAEGCAVGHALSMASEGPVVRIAASSPSASIVTVAWSGRGGVVWGVGRRANTAGMPTAAAEPARKLRLVRGRAAPRFGGRPPAPCAPMDRSW